ncbi:MAG: hypothetical protein HOE90_13310 [Bacteriovoracaceae bacterium]|jgi:hypothetical protein|nr:hypothetical protein [Bacteriovoracaceae bacterium]
MKKFIIFFTLVISFFFVLWIYLSKNEIQKGKKNESSNINSQPPKIIKKNDTIPATSKPKEKQIVKKAMVEVPPQKISNSFKQSIETHNLIVKKCNAFIKKFREKHVAEYFDDIDLTALPKSEIKEILQNFSQNCSIKAFDIETIDQFFLNEENYLYAIKNYSRPATFDFHSFFKVMLKARPGGDFKKDIFSELKSLIGNSVSLIELALYTKNLILYLKHNDPQDPRIYPVESVFKELEHDVSNRTFSNIQKKDDEVLEMAETYKREVHHVYRMKAIILGLL